MKAARFEAEDEWKQKGGWIFLLWTRSVTEIPKNLNLTCSAPYKVPDLCFLSCWVYSDFTHPDIRSQEQKCDLSLQCFIKLKFDWISFVYFQIHPSTVFLKTLHVLLLNLSHDALLLQQLKGNKQDPAAEARLFHIFFLLIWNFRILCRVGQLVAMCNLCHQILNITWTIKNCSSC